MVALNVDLRNVDPSIGGGAPVKPDGWYVGMVTESKSQGTRDSQQTGNTMLVLTFSFQDGSAPYQERLNLWHQKDDAKRIAYQNLAALCRAAGMTDAEMAVGDSNALHNRPINMYLTVTEGKTDEGRTFKRNSIAALKMPDGKILGNVPTTPPAGAQTTGATAGGFAAPPAPGAPQGGAPQSGFAPQPPQQQWGQGQGQPGPGGQPQAPQAPQVPAFPQPGAPQGGFPAPGAHAGGGFPAPGGWTPPQ